jgi:hypothetical protein
MYCTIKITKTKTLKTGKTKINKYYHKLTFFKHFI